MNMAKVTVVSELGCEKQTVRHFSILTMLLQRFFGLKQHVNGEVGGPKFGAPQLLVLRTMMEENVGEDFDLNSGTRVRNIGKCNRTFLVFAKKCSCRLIGAWIAVPRGNLNSLQRCE